MFANLSGLLMFSNIPFANVIGPLLIYFKTKGDSLSFALGHARNSLNFQITFSILSSILGIALIPVFFLTFSAIVASNGHTSDAGSLLASFLWLFLVLAVWGVVLLTNVALCIAAAVAAGNGHAFHYPAIPFVR